MRYKKFSGVVMSLMLSTGIMAACGSNGASGTADKGGAIKVGVDLELSGGVASYGQSIVQGLDLAVKEINKEGVLGKKLEVIKVDNKSDASEATNGAIKLINQDKVVAIIGSATSTNTLGQVQVADDSKVPLITPTGTNPTITNKDGKVNDFVFRTCFIDPFQGKVASNFALNELNVKTAAIFIDSASDYSKGLAASFKDAFTGDSGSIVSEEAYVAKDTDFRAQLTRIKSTNPEMVYVPGYYEEVGLIVKQARELGINVPFIGGDGWDSPTLIDEGGPDAFNNTYITNHYSSQDPDPKIQDFVKAFQAEYDGKSPDGFAALGYDTAYFLVDAIKRANSTDPVKIKDALASTKGLQLVSGKITLDKNHDPIKSATILEFVNGQEQFKTKVDPE